MHAHYSGNKNSFRNIEIHNILRVSIELIIKMKGRKKKKNKEKILNAMVYSNKYIRIF